MESFPEAEKGGSICTSSDWSRRRRWLVTTRGARQPPRFLGRSFTGEYQ
jgi:hypothetical protein